MMDWWMNLTDDEMLYGAVAILCVLLAAVLFRRILAYALKVVGRAVLGGGLLAVLSPFGDLLGLHLGVNLWNALVIGFLGAPGFGLLLLLNWIVN